MREFVASVMKKYRAKITPNWPIRGDTVHFTDRYNGRLYCGKVVEWISTGFKEEDIFWRVELSSGEVISCEFSELTQVDRSPENQVYVDAYNRGDI